jgi:hypothetical protein
MRTLPGRCGAGAVRQHPKRATFGRACGLRAENRNTDRGRVREWRGQAGRSQLPWRNAGTSAPSNAISKPIHFRQNSCAAFASMCRIFSVVLAFCSSREKACSLLCGWPSAPILLATMERAIAAVLAGSKAALNWRSRAFKAAREELAAAGSMPKREFARTNGKP